MGIHRVTCATQIHFQNWKSSPFTADVDVNSEKNFIAYFREVKGGNLLDIAAIDTSTGESEIKTFLEIVAFPFFFFPFSIGYRRSHF